jgi:hypothetical protein
VIDVAATTVGADATGTDAAGADGSAAVPVDAPGAVVLALPPQAATSTATAPIDAILILSCISFLLM